MDEHTISELMELCPELMQSVVDCAQVMDRIAALQPVGRRALAERLHMPERAVRTYAEQLKNRGLLRIDASGMMLTGEAARPLAAAREMVRSIRSLGALESKLTNLLGAQRVMILPGNADEDPTVLGEIGRTAAMQLRQRLSDGLTLAVTGGTTVAAVARALTAGTNIHVRVLPARGGLGRRVETQAGTLAAEIADKLGGTYALMHLPDVIAPEMQRELVKLPEIAEVLEMLSHTDVLLYGIGRADTLARRRGMSDAEISRLCASGAVAEAFGYYFSEPGEAVFRTGSVGLDIAQASHIRTVIAVAGGANKAEAILAMSRALHHDLLVTDEGAATRILQLSGK